MTLSAAVINAFDLSTDHPLFLGSSTSKTALHKNCYTFPSVSVKKLPPQPSCTSIALISLLYFFLSFLGLCCARAKNQTYLSCSNSLWTTHCHFRLPTRSWRTIPPFVQHAGNKLKKLHTQPSETRTPCQQPTFFFSTFNFGCHISEAPFTSSTR